MEASAPEVDLALLGRARRWLAHDPDPRTRAQLARWILAQDLAALNQAFDGRLRFGTAGLRALMGPGPKALNNLLVRQSCAGIAQVLAKEVPAAKARGVAIGFDGRHNSRAFAEAAAGVFLAAGFVVHFCEDEVPTPVVGFWVKTQQLACGVVVTASHNPPAYNGIKVYWQDGAQIVAPQDAAIAQAIDVVAEQTTPVACWTGAEFSAAEKLVWVAQDAQTAYLAALRTHLPGPDQGAHDAAANAASDHPAGAPLQVAYTPLHGVGAKLASRAVAQAGLGQLLVVEEQALPDGDFPTVAFPNPEEPGSMAAVLALAERHGCQLACANDPDADRLAVAARDGQGVLRPLSGDELGILLADFLATEAAKGGLVATTRASSRMLGHLAAARGLDFAETLTGFKWLARAGLAAASRGQKMVFAYEEALGYAVTTLVWDKDGISALVATLQLAQALAQRGETLWDQLARLQVRHGIFVSAQQTLALPSSDGSGLMRALRQRLPTTLGELQLLAHDDLLHAADAQPSQGTDVLILYFASANDSPQKARQEGLRVIVRPSGTEPKLKIYLELVGHVNEVAQWQDARHRLQAQLGVLGALLRDQVDRALA